MNPPTMLDSDLCVRVMITLGHFLWEAAVIAMAAGLAVRLLRRSAAHARYAVLVVALLLMAACPPFTFLIARPRAETAPEVVSPAPSAGDVAMAPVPVTPAVAEAGGPAALDPAYGPPAAVVERPAPVHAATASLEAASQEAAPTSRGARQRLAPYLTSAYLVGVVLMLLRLVVGLHGGGRLRRGAEPVTDGDLLSALSRQARRLGLRMAPAAAWCRLVGAPTVVGIVRPVILLPAALMSGLSAEQIEGVFLHELAHIRRHDCLVNLLQRLIEAFLFFHPAVWWVSGRIRAERENCCDDIAVAAGERPASYAALLLDLAEKSLAAPRGPRGHLVAVGAGGRSAGLRRRVLRLLGVPAEGGTRLGRSWPVALGLAVLVAAALIAHGRVMARQVAVRYPEAVREAVAHGSPIAGELALVLGDIGGAENLALLAKKCELWPTRELVLALGRTKSPDAFPVLRKAMAAMDPAYSFTAADALVRAGDPEVMGPLIGWLALPEFRPVAIRLAGMVGDAQLVEPLLKIESELEGKEERDLLYRALVACGNEKYLDEVHRQARDESDYLRESQREPPDPAMVHIIWNWRQNWALDAIQRLSSVKSLETLDALAQGAKDPKIRRRAREIAEAIRKEASDPVAQKVSLLAAQSELVIVGTVQKVFDGTARDAGMSYDVKVEKVLKGEHDAQTLRSRSGGWVGYARYREGERVLLFLDRQGGEFLQIKPVIYLGDGEKPAGALQLPSLEPYREVIAAGAVSAARAEPVEDRQGVSLTWRVEEREIYLGEPLDLFLDVRNTSAQSIVLPGALMSIMGVRIRSEPEGLTRKTSEGPYDSDYIVVTTPLKPNRMTMKRFWLYTLVPDLKPGRYTFQAVMKSDGKTRIFRKPTQEKPLGEYVEIPCWAGEAVSPPFELTVKPLEKPEDIAALKALAGEDYEQRADKRYWTMMWAKDIPTWRSLVRDHPNSIFTKHFEYRLGKVLNEFPRHAVASLQRVVDNYPVFSYTDDAKLKLATAYYRLGRDNPGQGFAARAVPVLADLIRNHPDGNAVFEARELLDRLKKEQAAKDTVPPLVAGLQDGDEAARQGAAQALGRIGAAANAAVPALIIALKDEKAAVRREAALALGRIVAEPRVAVPALIAALRDEVTAVRQAAAQALGLMGPRGVLPPVMVETLKDEGKELRAQDPVAALIEALNDARGEVGVDAAEALGRIGEPAVPALLRMLQTCEPRMRVPVAEALWSVGHTAGAAPTPEQLKERDRLLAEADAKLRDGLKELAKTYPQLAVANNRPLKDALDRAPARPGRLSVFLGRGNKPGKTPWEPEDIPDDRTWSLLAIIRPAGGAITALRMSALFPNLGLEGQCRATARDPKLDAALKKLLADALAPLAALEKKTLAARLPSDVRDLLLAEAHKKIRRGLLALSKRFPQMKTGNNQPLADALKDASQQRQIHIGRGSLAGKEFPHRPGQIDNPQAWLVNVNLRPGFYGEDHRPSGWRNVYPNLRLGGVQHASAGDPKLDAALKKLLVDALAPLAALEKKAAAGQSPSDLRDHLLTEGDAGIRKGLADLAARFPQLKKAPLWPNVGRKTSPPGSIRLYAAYGYRVKAEDDDVPERERWSVLVSVQPPPKEAGQLVMDKLYPHLGLVGQVGTAAGDPELDAALKKIVTDALAPLKALNEQVGKTQPDAAPRRVGAGPLARRPGAGRNTRRSSRQRLRAAGQSTGSSRRITSARRRGMSVLSLMPAKR